MFHGECEIWQKRQTAGRAALKKKAGTRHSFASSARWVFVRGSLFGWSGGNFS